MPDVFTVTGDIASRWNAYGGASGPFGRPIGPEHTVPGQNGVRQTFEFGEIAFSPDQQMLTSVFRLRNEAYFEWSLTFFDYDFYRYDIAFNGVPQGQEAIKNEGPLLFRWVRLQGFGEYAFKVKGCHERIGSDECKQGFTIPVRAQFAPFAETPDPGGPAVRGAIADRWHELGAWAGPLGKPLIDEVDFTVEGFRGQRFEQGWIATVPAFGPQFVFAVYARGPDIEVNWGGADRPFNAFRVTLFGTGAPQERLVWQFLNTEWARPSIGSGQINFTGLPNGFYEVTIEPTISSSFFPNPFEEFRSGKTPSRGTFLIHPEFDIKLDMPPQGYSPAEVYASQPSRATAIARAYARRLPLRVAFPVFKVDEPEATEDDMFQLIAHMHAACEDPAFRVPGELPSRVLAHVRMRQYRRGRVGTNRDYDMALKGLMTIVHRYRAMWTDKEIELILRDLLPPNLSGKHDPAVEIAMAVLGVDIPETENHLLMIESTRYFVNQLEFKRTGDRKFNNNANGLTGWLLDFITNIAHFDFLEFNARPYTRLSGYVLLNLYEFADDDALRLAAQHVLDYLMVKFAVSSNRYRRVPPFRRLQETTNHPETEWNDLYAPRGDLLTGFFLVYCGPIDPQHRLRDRFPGGWAQVCLIPAISSYRPPPAAYRLAMERRQPIQHRLVHGQRPRMPVSVDDAEGGVEIYFSSPSFLLSAGGMFLNSGYGRDEFFGPGLLAFAQTARAQAITLLPTRADLSFAETIRFDPFPDNLRPDKEDPIRGKAVTTGVHRGFACGANLRIPQRWLDLAGTAIEGPWIFLDLNRDVPGGKLGFYVAAYHAPVRDLVDVILAGDINTEVSEELQPRLDNLGCLYAIEADRMPFDAFKRMTLERNTHLPAKFDYGETNDFHTADLHTFTFLLAPSQSIRGKYDARVRAMDGVAISDHVGSLPLVDGEHVRSPERGKIEIHAPDCPTPLVLDYREARRPERSDDRAACPGPWRERDEQVIGFTGQWLTRSRELTAALKPIESIAAVRQAVATLRAHVPLPENATRHWDLLEACVQALALRLIDAHQIDEALIRIDETVDVAKRAAALPNSNRHALAGQLLNLATQITVSISSAAAIPPVQAAIDILRDAAALPAASAEVTSLFAVSLQTLTDRVFDAQRPADAARTARDAIAAYRRAAAAPGANVPALARQLVSLSTRLTANALVEDAVTSLDTAAAMLRPIAMTRGAAADTRALFAVTLQALTVGLLDAGRPADAPPVAREATAAFRHAADAPGADRVARAGELFTLSGRLAMSGLTADAVPPIEASTDILRGTASTAGAPIATRSLFATLLHTQAQRLIAVGRNDAALDAADEAIAFYRTLAAEDPATFAPQLAVVERLAATLRP